MRATDAIKVEKQIRQPAGQPCQTKSQVVCPHCLRPVARPSRTARGELFRRHKRPLPNGQRCPHGLTERDPAGTNVAF